MNKIERLQQNYAKFIAIPWRNDTPSAQRVMFCVYDETDELRLRAKLDEFELATKQANHSWYLFDLTNNFSEWMVGQRYSQKYFERPELLPTTINSYLTFIQTQFEKTLQNNSITDNHVVAISGVGSLFGFLKVRDVVDILAKMVPGRLLVFFPGSYDQNNYRLLDGYDGWNYLAVPITADKEYI